MNCRARDRLRQREPQPRSFVPAISVEQMVLFDDRQAREYRTGVHNKLGTNLGSTFRRRYSVLKPEQMRLSVIRADAMADQVRNSREKLRIDHARQIMYLLKIRLEELLAETQSMPLQIGQVAPYEEDHPRKPFRQVSMIGAYPLGWKGAKSRIAAKNADGHTPASAIIRQTGLLCSRVIAEEHGNLEPRSLVADPRIPVIGMKRSGKVPASDLSVISEAVIDSLPEGAQLSHPVLTLQTGAGRRDTEVATLDVPGAGILLQPAA